MVSESNVYISIIFCVMFRGFDILVVSKNMFLHVFVMFLHFPYKFVGDYVDKTHFQAFICVPTTWNGDDITPF